jgi:hypothetical protein
MVLRNLDLQELQTGIRRPDPQVLRDRFPAHQDIEDGEIGAGLQGSEAGSPEEL